MIRFCFIKRYSLQFKLYQDKFLYKDFEQNILGISDVYIDSFFSHIVNTIRITETVRTGWASYFTRVTSHHVTAACYITFLFNLKLNW